MYTIGHFYGINVTEVGETVRNRIIAIHFIFHIYTIHMENPNRHLLAFASGIVGGLIPNTRSNIHPIVLGAVLALLLSKLLFGDYDRGFQWTIRDVWFLCIVGTEGALGAFLTSLFPL